MNPSETVMLTDAIYYASLNPACLALAKNYCVMSIPGYGYNPTSAAALLAAAQMTGTPIDTQIMLWGWPPTITMTVRQNDGYGWVPPWGAANINIAPGLPAPAGQTSNYPATMPAGWIKVSTTAADYPAYVAPVAPAVPVIWTPNLSEMLSWTEVIKGVQVTQYFYGVVAGQNPQIGQPCTYNGMNFQAQYYPQGGPVGGPPKMWLLTGLAV